MLAKIGFILIILGAMMGESESLKVPFVMMTLGAILLWIGRKAVRYDEKE